MARNEEAGTWTPVVRKSDGPVYLAIADALSSDILSGALPEGTRLPTQRSLAEASISRPSPGRMPKRAAAVSWRAE
jgi:hypothetical protein